MEWKRLETLLDSLNWQDLHFFILILFFIKLTQLQNETKENSCHGFQLVKILTFSSLYFRFAISAHLVEKDEELT